MMKYTLLFAVSSMGFVPVALPEELLGPTSVVVIQGEPGNGRCCVVGGGELCESVEPVGGCGYNPIYNCSCVNPGADCWIPAVMPTSNDICKKMSPPVPAFANCTLVTTWCWTRYIGGTCDNDGGPWSWGGFCTTCGCTGTSYPDETPEGSRQMCSGGSTGC
jgi:hypothetical protein